MKRDFRSAWDDWTADDINTELRALPSDKFAKLVASFLRVKNRFDREGPFVLDEDDLDGIALGIAGKRVTYVDTDSIATEKKP